MNKQEITKKQRMVLVARLERAFPDIEMVFPTHLFNDETDFAPEHSVDWNEFLETLDRNGLTIADKKNV